MKNFGSHKTARKKMRHFSNGLNYCKSRENSQSFVLIYRIIWRHKKVSATRAKFFIVIEVFMLYIFAASLIVLHNFCTSIHGNIRKKLSQFKRQLYKFIKVNFSKNTLKENISCIPVDFSFF